MRQGKQGVPAHAVDLVQRQDDLGVRGLEVGDDGLGVLGRAPVGGLAFLALGGNMGGSVDQVDDHIGIRGPAPGRGDHGAVQPATGCEDAGGVHQHDLGIPLDRDATHRETGGLDLLRDDRDLGSGQPVDQRRLARIRQTDQASISD